MQSFSNGFEATSPIELLHQGEAWLDLWDHAKNNDSRLLPAIYCLLSALEMYLKAYIILKDDSFSSTKKLRKSLGHNFNSLFNEVQRLSEPTLTAQIKVQLQKYRLFDDLQLDTLKYPESGRLWSMNSDLVKGEHSLGSIFDQIQSEINAGQEEWLRQKYPKHVEPGLLFQFDYEGEPTKLTSTDQQILVGSCSNCLPVGIIINEYYNFPWHSDPVPARTCVVCKNWFMPGGSRHHNSTHKK